MIPADLRLLARLPWPSAARAELQAIASEPDPELLTRQLLVFGVEQEGLGDLTWPPMSTRPSGRGRPPATRSAARRRKFWSTHRIFAAALDARSHQSVGNLCYGCGWKHIFCDALGDPRWTSAKTSGLDDAGFRRASPFLTGGFCRRSPDLHSGRSLGKRGFGSPPGLERIHLGPRFGL